MPPYDRRAVRKEVADRMERLERLIDEDRQALRLLRDALASVPVNKLWPKETKASRAFVACLEVVEKKKKGQAAVEGEEGDDYGGCP